jgi:hypothetical protein
MSWMRKILEFFDDDKNWISGCLCGLGIVLLYVHLPLLWNGLRPVTLTAWASLVVMFMAFPAAWGIYRRNSWGRGIGLAIGSIMVFTLSEQAVNDPTIGHVLMAVGAISFCWMVWQLDLREPWEQFTESTGMRRFRVEVEKRVLDDQQNPLPSCEVILHCSKLLELDAATLSRAITQAFHRPCSISEDEDNIGLAVDIASSTTQQAVVGGYGNMWMIGVSPVCMQVITMPAGDGQNEDGGFIHLNLTRRLDRDVEISNGYSWTIPLGAALWSSVVVKASLANEERQEFATPDDLLAAIPQLA